MFSHPRSLPTSSFGLESLPAASGAGDNGEEGEEAEAETGELHPGTEAPSTRPYHEARPQHISTAVRGTSPLSSSTSLPRVPGTTTTVASTTATTTANRASPEPRTGTMVSMAEGGGPAQDLLQYHAAITCGFASFQNLTALWTFIVFVPTALNSTTVRSTFHTSLHLNAWLCVCLRCLK